MGHNVICISREDGAGAHEVASCAADRLGFRVIDEDIVTRAALEAGVERDVVADVERGKTALVRLIEGFGAAGMGIGYMGDPTSGCAQGQPASDDLRALIRSVIEDTASKGRVVILAHAASLALSHRGTVLRVLVTASPKVRAQRIASTLGVDEKKAAQAVKRSDAGRADYIKRFYGVGRERPSHYDLVINTDRLTPEQAARLIVAATAASEDAGQAAPAREPELARELISSGASQRSASESPPRISAAGTSQLVVDEDAR
jgi:cytidylate kinase